MNQTRINYFLYGLLGLILLLKSLETLWLFGHGDALYYHLPLGKIWLEEGLHAAFTNVCGVLQSGYFDMLFVIPQLFFGSGINGQLGAQFLHFLFSIGLGSALAYYYFARFNERLAILAALSMLTFRISSDFFLYAKNDGAMALAALFCGLLVFDDQFLPRVSGRKRQIFIGVMLGLVPGIKINGVFIVGPMALYYAWVNRQSLRKVVFVALISILTWAPLLVRNYIYSGTPIFPALANTFPGFMPDDMIDTYTFFMSNPMSLETLGQNLRTFFTAKTFFLLFPLFIFYKKKSTVAFKLAASSSLFLLSYLAVNGGIHYPRFLFCCFFFNLFAFFILAKDYPLSKTKFLIWAVILVLIDSKIDKTIGRVAELPNQFSKDQSILMQERSPKSKIWNYIKPKGEKTYIITDDFNEFYYAPKGTRLHCTKCNFNVSFLLTCNSDFLERISKYDYAILQPSRGIKNDCYDFIRSGRKLYSTHGYDIFEIPKFIASYLE